MNQLKKLFAVAALTACVLPVAAQYPVIPDSVKIRGEEQQKEIDRKSDEAWAKALPVVICPRLFKDVLINHGHPNRRI